MLRNDQEEARNDKPPKQNDHRDNEAKKYHDIKKGTTQRHKITTMTTNY